MIKGVNKQIIEVNDPDSIYFEKAVFYLRAGVRKLPAEVSSREIDRCFGGSKPACWNRIYLAATASNQKSRYQTVAELGRAIARRHWKRFVAMALAAAALCAIVCICIDAMVTCIEERNVPRMFDEDDI